MYKHQPLCNHPITTSMFHAASFSLYAHSSINITHCIKVPAKDIICECYAAYSALVNLQSPTVHHAWALA